MPEGLDNRLLPQGQLESLKDIPEEWSQELIRPWEVELQDLDQLSEEDHVGEEQSKEEPQAPANLLQHGHQWGVLRDDSQIFEGLEADDADLHDQEDLANELLGIVGQLEHHSQEARDDEQRVNVDEGVHSSGVGDDLDACDLDLHGQVYDWVYEAEEEDQSNVVWAVIHLFSLAALIDVQPVVDVDLHDVDDQHDEVDEEVRETDQVEIETYHSPLVLNEVRDRLCVEDRCLLGVGDQLHEVDVNLLDLVEEAAILVVDSLVHVVGHIW